MAYPDGIDLSENNSHKLVITAVVFLALTYTCVALRTYTRAFLTKAFQLDDWIMLVGLVSRDFAFGRLGRVTYEA